MNGIDIAFIIVNSFALLVLLALYLIRYVFKKVNPLIQPLLFLFLFCFFIFNIVCFFLYKDDATMLKVASLVTVVLALLTLVLAFLNTSKQSVEKNDFEIAYEILKPTGLVGYVELIAPMRSSFVVDFDMRFVEYVADIEIAQSRRAYAGKVCF